MTEHHHAPHPYDRDLARARVLSWVVLGQMLLSLTVSLIQQPSSTGLAFFAGLPVFWGGLFGGIGGAGGLLVNGVLSTLSLFYGVRALKRLKRAEQPKRPAYRVIVLSALTTSWWAAQAATTVMVIWVLNSVWG